jgi:hypothetical protein
MDERFLEATALDLNAFAASDNGILEETIGCESGDGRGCE